MTPIQTILQKFNSMTPPDFDDWLLDNKHELIRLELCALNDAYREGYRDRDEENIAQNYEQVDNLFNQWHERYFRD